MNKSELLQKCKEMGIKGVSSKTKGEIVLIIKEQEQKKETTHINFNIIENKLTDLLKELIIKTPKDKQRKVCKNCNELGHNITSVICKINIDKNNKLKQKIMFYLKIV
jgi:DNA-binding protein YbaB